MLISIGIFCFMTTALAITLVMGDAQDDECEPIHLKNGKHRQ